VCRHADGGSGGRRPQGKPYSWRQLVAAGLLHRYGWTGHDPGRGFDAWEVQHRREMLEVMKQIRAPVIVKLSGAPTPQEARNGRGSGVQ
jgi:hypothetical protein